MRQEGIKVIDHTGDVGIKVSADSLEQLFERAAQGMFGIICPSNLIRPRSEFEFDVDGNGREELLVNWLAELNYYFSVEYLLFSKFYILRLDNNKLYAKARGEKINTERHRIHTEIKAVTYHKLYLRQIKGVWRAQIIFDI